jgi:nucleotide-binding universal stress UspA family protein
MLFKNILVATNGSDLAVKAVEQGVLFAKEMGAKITAVTITEPFHFSRPRQANSNTPRSDTRNIRRRTPRKCSVLFPTQQNWPVSPARRFTSSTNKSIRRSSMLQRRESAI